MKWLDRLWGRETKGADVPAELVREMSARVIRLSPRLRLAKACDERLASSLAVSLRYLDELLGGMRAPHEASAEAWAEDPYIHAFFGAADEVAPTLCRSSTLRGFFKRSAAAQEAWAALGMEMSERTTLGVAMEDGVTRSDVQQTVLGFSDHQVRVCAATEAEFRQELRRRMVDQLAIEGLALMTDDEERREELGRERALLATRLQILQRQGRGMRSVHGGDEEPDELKLAKLREEMEANDRELESLGSRAEALERQLDHVCQVLDAPREHLRVQMRRLRLSRMNVVLPDDDAQGDMLELPLARVPGNPPRERALCLLRFSRSNLVAGPSLSEEAARLLR
jgi:hypothetical protein